MGGFFSSMWNKLFKSAKSYNILILGLANAGKTTILYQMSLGKAVETTPTIGSNVEEMTHNNVKFSAWDLGGQQRIRGIWSTYYSRTDAVIFVIDSSDLKSEVIAKTQLFKVVINQNLKDAPILVLANKQDAKGALTQQQLSSRYSLHQIKDHSWRLQLCSAIEGTGIREALDWLTQQLLKKM